MITKKQKVEIAKEFRKNGTKSERMLWKYVLKENKYSWLKQRIIKGYIADFYCKELKLVIEVDGESHDTVKTADYDNKRTEILEAEGLKVIRVRNEDVLAKIHSMKDYLDYLIKEREKGNL